MRVIYLIDHETIIFSFQNIKGRLILAVEVAEKIDKMAKITEIY